MSNSVLVGFLGQVDLEKHTTKDRKAIRMNSGKYIGRPRILLSSFSGSS